MDGYKGIAFRETFPRKKENKFSEIDGLSPSFKRKTLRMSLFAYPIISLEMRTLKDDFSTGSLKYFRMLIFFISTATTTTLCSKSRWIRRFKRGSRSGNTSVSW